LYRIREPESGLREYNRHTQVTDTYKNELSVKNIMQAEIISIGTELLLGEIVDTNTRFIAQALREIGVNVFRTFTVGDNAERIAEAIQESTQRAQIVITTGGLGPTIDDATREGISLALERDLEFHPELWRQIQERFARYGRQPTENNRRQAHLPSGAIAIDNPIGTAPGFYFESSTSVIFALQGVPAEMEHAVEKTVIPYLREKFNLKGIIKTRIIRTSGLGESAVDTRIEDLEKISNPTVGLAAHPGRVDVRITAKAKTIDQADEMIWRFESTIRQRLGEHVYGVDEHTLEAATLARVAAYRLRLVVVECGTNGALTAALSPLEEPFVCGQILTHFEDQEQFASALSLLQQSQKARLGMGLYLTSESERHLCTIFISSPVGSETLTRTYGGPPAYAAQWAASVALDRLRRHLA
jgi:nicotinamide-nucleotide amidase